MKKDNVLTTDRLTLRGITEQDAEAIVALRSDPEVYRFFTSPHRITLEEHLDWFENRYQSDANRYDWVGIDRSGRIVGVFGARRVSDTACEISYILGREYYGKGYAREVVEKILAFCARYWNTKTVVAVIHKDNANSIRFIERLGFIKSEGQKNGDFLVYQKETEI